MKRGVVLLSVLLGCGAEPPLVALDVGQVEGTAPILGLERLRLIVQSCGAAAPIVSVNLGVRDEARPPIEAPLVPGTSRSSNFKSRDSVDSPTAIGRIQAEIRMPHIGAEKAAALKGCAPIRLRRPMQPPIEWAIRNHGRGSSSASAKVIEPSSAVRSSSV